MASIALPWPASDGGDSVDNQLPGVDGAEEEERRRPEHHYHRAHYEEPSLRGPCTGVDREPIEDGDSSSKLRRGELQAASSLGPRSIPGHWADRSRKRRRRSLVVRGEAGTLLAAAEHKYEHH